MVGQGRGPDLNPRTRTPMTDEQKERRALKKTQKRITREQREANIRRLAFIKSLRRPGQSTSARSNAAERDTAKHAHRLLPYLH